MNEARIREHRSESVEQTLHVGRTIAREITMGDLVLIDGDLGAGKTTLTRGIADGLGIDPDQVSSPTYTICREHELEDGCSMIHVDAWRIESSEDLDSIGWDEFAGSKNTIVVVEWAKRLNLPSDSPRMQVDLEHIGEQGRLIRVSLPRS
ncbi:MAG: tRNA (adenosine(37)-N6)-threonylcarbamoyltransferase complex ATPase subunit type 1 TsaE [Phycisphaerae bacterium]|nr:tRNA (adenosine(37)-N6)-threonylcarbamoyltransferase complex ATPase subunit type 1 TsaE [Phycisphaerae bacterium]